MKFDPKNIERLMRADRLEGTTPEELLREAGLKEGDAVADVGCGPGFFTVPAARVVGPKGVVYAVDPQEEMLRSLGENAPEAENIRPVLSNEAEIPLEDSVADFTLAAYVLHETELHRELVSELFRVTRPGGILLVLDWKKVDEEKGPPVEIRLSAEEAASLLEEAGFTDIRIAPLTVSHYRITAVKAAS